MVYTSINTQDWSLLTFVPMSVVNEKSNLLLRITFLLCGLITLAFAGLVAVLMYSSYRNKRKLEQIAYVDEVTGGHTIQKFYELASANLQAAERPQYALVYSNIQKFKVLNEQFGRRTGDNILKAFHQSLTETLKNKECIGRISADNFCFLIEYQGEDFLLEWFEYWYSRVEEYIKVNKPSWSLPVTEFGVYVIENDSIPFSQMIDRAKLALRESPHNINSKLR